MTAQEIITKIQSQGAAIEPKGEGFTVKALRGSISVELREVLATHKAEIVSILNRQDSGIEPQFFKGLDCPTCRKPVKVITHTNSSEVWLNCTSTDCLFMRLPQESREWCR